MIAGKLKLSGAVFLFVFILVSIMPAAYYGANEGQGTQSYAVVWPELAEEPYGKSAILMERDTGAVLYGKNVDERLYPASITKIMTGLLAVENLSLSDTVTFTEEILNSLPWDAAIQGVSPGETMTVKDCLYSLMLRSNNDMAVALAYKIAGNEEEFAKMMTERAKKAGALNTNFVNATGLHDENHYTTARDMALITKEAMSNPTFAEIWGTSSYELPATNMSEGFTIWHRHNMLVSGRADYYQYATGGKTGYTDEAGRTLVTSGENNGIELIAVIMYSTNESVFEDTKNLLNYGFNNFKKITIKDNEERFGQGGDTGFSLINKIYGTDASLFTIGNGSVIIPKNEELKNIEYVIDMNIDDTGLGEAAKITYVHNGYSLGEAILYVSQVYSGDESSVSSLERKQEEIEKAGVREIFSINIYYIAGGALAAVIAAFLIRIWIKRLRKRRIGKRYYIKR